MKRSFDLLVSAVLLIVTTPLGLAVASAIWFFDGSPVLFRQQRSGQNGRPFTLVKFRTMRAARDDTWDPGDDAERKTRLGRLLRSTSLDELPTLLNVVAGDMSLVGPRPLPVSYLKRYDENQARRLEVRPGITGWAVVAGRNALRWQDRFSADVWYVDHRSFCLDLRIIARSVGMILRRTAIDHAEGITMTEFRGPGS